VLASALRYLTCNRHIVFHRCPQVDAADDAQPPHDNRWYRVAVRLARPVVVGHWKVDQCAGGAIRVVTCQAADPVIDRLRLHALRSAAPRRIARGLARRGVPHLRTGPRRSVLEDRPPALVQVPLPIRLQVARRLRAAMRAATRSWSRRFGPPPRSSTGPCPAPASATESTPWPTRRWRGSRLGSSATGSHCWCPSKDVPARRPSRSTSPPAP
jgi:hypothetical protein